MLNNKEEVIEKLINSFQDICEQHEADAQIKLISNHGEVVAYDSCDEDGDIIHKYVNVYEYCKVTEHFGTTDVDELNGYIPTEEVLEDYSELIGRFGDFDGMMIKLEAEIQPYVDFNF